MDQRKLIQSTTQIFMRPITIFQAIQAANSSKSWVSTKKANGTAITVKIKENVITNLLSKDSQFL